MVVSPAIKKNGVVSAGVFVAGKFCSLLGLEGAILTWSFLPPLFTEEIRVYNRPKPLISFSGLSNSYLLISYVKGATLHLWGASYIIHN